MQNIAIPKKLYKYRTFSVKTLKIFESGTINYSKPSLFNDPLDCNPSISADIDLDMLEQLFFSILIDEKDKDYADKTIGELRYSTTQYGDYNADPDVFNYYIRLLSSKIKRLINNEFNNYGVFCLSKDWDCPLMWSHYADEHRGLCIEFETSAFKHQFMKYVNYNAPRSIKASDLYEWKINRSRKAKSIVQDTFFFSKAHEWDYENEWRDINSFNGPLPSSFQITAVHFGFRCDSAVITTILKLLSNYPKIIFYQIYSPDDSFKLGRRPFDDHDFESHRAKESAFFMFRDVILKN